MKELVSTPEKLVYVNSDERKEAIFLGLTFVGFVLFVTYAPSYYVLDDFLVYFYYAFVVLGLLGFLVSLPERETFTFDKQAGIVYVETSYMLFRKPNRVLLRTSLIDAIQLEHYSSVSRYARVPAGDENYAAQQAEQQEESGNKTIDRNLARLVLNCTDGRVFATSTHYFKKSEEKLRNIAGKLSALLRVPIHTDLSDDEGFEDQGSEWFVTEKEKKSKPPQRFVLNAPMAKKPPGAVVPAGARNRKA